MFDPTTIKDAYAQTREVPERVSREHDTDPAAIESLWGTWLSITATLLKFGVSQREVCDSAATLVSATESAGQGMPTR